MLMVRFSDHIFLSFHLQILQKEFDYLLIKTAEFANTQFNFVRDFVVDRFRTAQNPIVNERSIQLEY